MARRVVGVKKKKRVLKKSIVPAEIVQYLKHDICNPGLMSLNNFLEKTDPAVVVKAVSAVLKPRLAMAKKEAESEMKYEIERANQYVETANNHGLQQYKVVEVE